MADDTKTQDDEQELGDFLGVDPIYMNYSDDRNKPFRAEADDEADGPQSNEEVLATEETAYAHQEFVREDAGQDPVTGESLDISPAEQLKAQRAVFADPDWSPNIPSRMTGKEEAAGAPVAVSNETDEEFAKRVAKANETNAASSPDPAPVDEAAPSAPAAPAAKKAASSSNK